jgi:hypothetical protein
MSDSKGEPAPEKRRGLKEPWKPGQSGNPAGRKKGSRHKLSELLLSTLCADFEEHGADTIKEVREKNRRPISRLLPASCPSRSRRFKIRWVI